MSVIKTSWPKKYFSSYKKPLVGFPNLLETQVQSYEWFKKEGIKEVLKEFSPITDYSQKKFNLTFESFSIGEPKHDEYYAKENKISYDAPLKFTAVLENKSITSKKEQEVFMVDIPIMTAHGTFIINGVERVIVPQLARSFGVFFTAEEYKGKKLFGAKVIPARGVWIEIESDVDGCQHVRIDRKRKFPVTSLLRVFGYESDKEILEAFSKDAQEFIAKCLAKDGAKTKSEAYIEIYKRLRDGDLATADNAKEFIDSLFTPERYDLSTVGRFRFNGRFDRSTEKKDLENRILSKEDIVTTVAHIISLNNTKDAKPDDIARWGQGRVR